MMKSSLQSLRRGLLTGPQAAAMTLAATTFAALLSMAAMPLARTFPFTLFLLAVAISAWFGGVRQGILAVLLAPFVVHFLLVPLTDQPRYLARVVVWLIVGSVVAIRVGILRGFQRRSQTVLAHIDEGVVILDHDWSIIYINEAGSQFAGRRPREMIGQNYWKVMPDARGTAVEQNLRQCAAEQAPVQFEARMRRTERSLHVRAYPVPDGICFFSQDISETKEREIKLRAILDHWAAAHQAARIGTWEWNLRTNAMYWSEEIPRIHHIPEEGFDGKLSTFVKNIHPEDVARFRANLRDTIKGKEEYYIEFRVVSSDLKTRFLRSHGRVFRDKQNRAERLVGITSDVTERRLEEEALRRSEKLAATGRLAATIAHEINNPLEAVTNLIYLLRQNPCTSDAQDLLRLADEQLARVNHIAKQTLGFYQDRNVPESVDVVEALDDLLSILQSRIHGKQLHVERECENVCLLSNFRGELRQVLSNLLTNAIDASPSGGRLIVRAKPENDRNEISAIRIEIEDFGSGIPPADQAKIFEPFFTTKSDVGTGLGLWVTKDLVEKNGGTISFRSNWQGSTQGTCFVVVLPVSMSVAQAAKVRNQPGMQAQ